MSRFSTRLNCRRTSGASRAIRALASVGLEMFLEGTMVDGRGFEVESPTEELRRKEDGEEPR